MEQMVWKISLWWEEKRKWRVQLLTALSSFALWKSARAAGRRGLVEHISPSAGQACGMGGDAAGRAGGRQGWGQAACAHRQSGASHSTDMHLNYSVNSRVTSQSVSAICLTAALRVPQAQEAADLRLARTTVVSISGCCSGLPLVGVSVSWIQLPLTSMVWGTLATSVRPLCLSVFIARALCRSSHFHQLLLSPAPCWSDRALHTREVTACSHTRSVTLRERVTSAWSIFTVFHWKVHFFMIISYWFYFQPVYSK